MAPTETAITVEVGAATTVTATTVVVGVVMAAAVAVAVVAADTEEETLSSEFVALVGRVLIELYHRIVKTKRMGIHVTSAVIKSKSFSLSRLNDYRSSKRKWDLSKLPKFEKDFYREHPDVTRRSMVSQCVLIVCVCVCVCVCV